MLSVSVVGMYGVVAYGVSQRRAELGIRIALGARRGDIVHAVAGCTGLAVGGGLLAGVMITAVATRGIERFLFGVSRLDPLAGIGAAVVLGPAAVVACGGPVRRAIMVDPTSAMRADR